MVQTLTALKKVLYLQNIAKEPIKIYAGQMQVPLVYRISLEKDTSVFKIIVLKMFLSSSKTLQMTLLSF